MTHKIVSGDILVLPTGITYLKLKPLAEAPSKDNIKDVGYEITIIEREDNRVEDVYGDINYFSTGLVLNAPKHHHLEVLEHPSLHKTGYTMVGGPKIINPDNTEELVLGLHKFKEVDDIELPFRAAIIVTRESIYCSVTPKTIKEVDRYQDRYQEERPKPFGAYSQRQAPSSSRTQTQRVAPKGKGVNSNIF